MCIPITFSAMRRSRARRSWDTRICRAHWPRVGPGHVPVSAWPAALADERRYFEKLGADVRALIRRGDTINAAAGSAAESERGKWELFEESNARNATAAFSELEWE